MVIETYTYIQKLLNESGIDFKNIDKDDLLFTCESYKGELSKNNYIIALTAINDICGIDK